MNRKLILAGAVALLMALTLGASAAWAQDNTKPAYTVREYNDYQAAVGEKAAQARVKLLDEFVAKYPESTLLPHIYQSFYTTYNELRNAPKTIEYADKLLGFKDKLDLGTRLQALYIRALSFHSAFTERAADAAQQATNGRAAAAEGLKVLSELPKPESMSPEDFEKQKKGPTALFNYTAGVCSAALKDWKVAAESYKAAIAINPDGLTYYRLGLVYLASEQHMDGFWALARSLALKGPNENQVRKYLRNQIARYQQPACEALLDSQLKELLALAAASPERPASYAIPSAADLTKAREGVATFIDDLKAGGDKAKLMWFAVCGLEFPDVAVKVIEVADGNDSVLIKAFRGDTQEIMEAAKEPNMEIKVEGQPDAKRVEKDTFVRVTGTLSGYQPDPFLIFWDKAKVNTEDIPEAKPDAPAKKAPVKKASAKKAPAKKAPPKKPGL